jgi:hypothetical protein
MWLQQKNGFNVLRMPDGTERFPGFDLYRKIAQNVENAVPYEQVTKPIFDTKYRIDKDKIPADEKIWDIYAA